MNVAVRRFLVLLAGWGCILLGIAGLLLPVLQGILFLLIGLAILSSEYVWAHKLLHKLRRRFPRLARLADEATAIAHRWLRRISGKNVPEASDRDCEESKVHDGE